MKNQFPLPAVAPSRSADSRRLGFCWVPMSIISNRSGIVDEPVETLCERCGCVLGYKHQDGIKCASCDGWTIFKPVCSVNEAATRMPVEHELENAFHIDREITGQHWSGQMMRLDAVLRPKRSYEWKRPDVAFGVEFKDDGLHSRFSGDTKTFMKAVNQCIDYSDTRWDGYGHLCVFLYPGLDKMLGKDGPQNRVGYIFRRLIGQRGVGELRRSNYYGLTLAIHGSHRIWSQRNGVEDMGRKYNMRPKFGSR